MKALWGRKVSDLGFGQFLNVVNWVASKHGKIVRQIATFTPTTQLCSSCGQRHNLTLKDRTLDCSCGLVIGRDHNAAINIKFEFFSPGLEHAPAQGMNGLVDRQIGREFSLL